MFRFDLNVHELKSPFLQVPDKSNQCNIGGIPMVEEHRLGSEQSADGYAVHSTGKFIANPRFDTVSVAESVKFDESFNHFRGDPSSALLVPLGTTSYDTSEISVRSDMKSSAFTCSFQPSGNVKLVELKDTSGIGREPSEHVASPAKWMRYGPWEDAVRVRVEQPIGGQFPADVEETVFVGVIGIGEKTGHGISLCNLLTRQKEKRSGEF